MEWMMKDDVMTLIEKIKSYQAGAIPKQHPQAD